MTDIENGLTLDDHGIQMPWYTRPALAVIDKWDLQDKLIFEYGVGYSTLWYKSRGCVVYGVDSSLEWVKIVNDGKIVLEENKRDYIESSIHGPYYYDVVVIDGLFRDECTEYALERLATGGKLILDNWLQKTVEPEWPKTQKLIEGMPIELYYEPGHWDNWCTAIVTKV